VALAAVLGLALTSATSAYGREPTQASGDPVIMAAGDIACDPDDPGYNGGAGTADRCRQRATSDLLVGAGPAAVLPLGDLQYASASLSNILAVYDPSWGRVKSISRPVLGNHEGDGDGYFDYFNGDDVWDGPAGPRDRGYYSFDIGGWHLVALNSNCSKVACSAGSEQEQWLRADLAAHPRACTLAYWHHPRYSSGHGGSNTSMQPLWEALDDAEAEIVLTGHSHHYERFAPLDRNGVPDAVEGIRQFVVGTGGVFFTGIGSTIRGSEVAQNHTFGVLKLTLHPTSYVWEFVPEAGKTFTDSGSAACHGVAPVAPVAPPPVAPVALPPGPPEDLVAPLISGLRLFPKRFMAGSRGTAPAAGRARRGATFRYTLSEAATVRFSIRRRSEGRRVGGVCRPRTPENLKSRPCIRYRRVGRFEQSGVAGANTRRFLGRIGTRQLRPGAFRAALVATDAAGNRSSPQSESFTIVRPPRRGGPKARRR
jgi:acid phosphatase type 7